MHPPSTFESNRKLKRATGPHPGPSRPVDWVVSIHWHSAPSVARRPQHPQTTVLSFTSLNCTQSTIAFTLCSSVCIHSLPISLPYIRFRETCLSVHSFGTTRSFRYLPSATTVSSTKPTREIYPTFLNPSYEPSGLVSFLPCFLPSALSTTHTVASSGPSGRVRLITGTNLMVVGVDISSLTPFLPR